jgi:hypothetical protein
MVAADRMPAQISVNTALRNTFFTMVLLSSFFGTPWGNPSLFIGCLIEARFEPEEISGCAPNLLNSFGPEVYRK